MNPIPDEFGYYINQNLFVSILDQARGFEFSVVLKNEAVLAQKEKERLLLESQDKDTFERKVL